MCWMLREPRREDHATWTAVAPDPVFAVLIYGTSQLHGPSLVRESASASQKPAGQRDVPHVNPRS
jgi:hypothetical protein